MFCLFDFYSFHLFRTEAIVRQGKVSCYTPNINNVVHLLNDEDSERLPPNLFIFCINLFLGVLETVVATLSIIHGEQTVIAQADYKFVYCGAIKSCTECESTENLCSFCSVSNRCIDRVEKSCRSDVSQYLHR